MKSNFRLRCGVVWWLALCLFIGCQRGSEHKRAQSGTERAASARETRATMADTSSQRGMITGETRVVGESGGASADGQSAIRIVFSSEAYSSNAALGEFAGTLLLTDPQGRRTGEGATGQSFEEIPRSSYYDDVIGEATEEEENAGAAWRVIEAVSPAGGRYELLIQGAGKGHYSLSFAAHRGDQTALNREINDIPIRAGTEHHFAFDFGKSIDPRSWVRGGYAGSGNETGFANQMLSYANVTRERTRVPSAAKSAALLIVYAEGIEPATFRASLDGSDFSHAFSPAGGTAEMVSVPIHPGDCVLILSIEGAAPDDGGKDVDQLIFHVAGARPR